MLWSDRIFLGRGVRRNYRRIKWKIMHNIAQQGVFLLVLPTDRAGNPEIIPSPFLLQKNYPKEELCVIGLAESRPASFALLEQITAQMYEKTKTIDYYSFFELERPNKN